MRVKIYSKKATKALKSIPKDTPQKQTNAREREIELLKSKSDVLIHSLEANNFGVYE